MGALGTGGAGAMPFGTAEAAAATVVSTRGSRKFGRLALVPRVYSSGWTAPAPSGAPMLRGTLKPARTRRSLVLTRR